jgi:hypothetical protein
MGVAENAGLPMRRLKRILKWAGIIAGAAIVLLPLFNVLFVRSAGTRLEERLDALRRAGEPVRIADLAHPPIPPERNADAFLRRAAGDLEAIRKQLEEWYPRTGYPTGALTPSDQERLEKLFADHPRFLPALEQAADCPDSDPQLDTTLPPSRFLDACLDRVGPHRVLSRVLKARSALLLSKGRPDDAVAAQLLALRLARHWHRETMLIGFLVTASGEYVAIEEINRVLQAGPVSPSARRALDAEVALHDTIDGYVWALRSERAFSVETLRDQLGPGSWLTRGFINQALLRLLDLYDRHLRYAALPYPRAVAERRSAPSLGGGWNPYGRLATLLEPGLLSAREPAERVRAMSRSLRVLNALQAREPAGGDPIPPLNDLGLPRETTIDPFDGETLRVKKTPRGWTVYSVGGNGVDDGGTLEKGTDIGLGPVNPETTAKTP